MRRLAATLFGAALAAQGQPAPQPFVLEHFAQRGTAVEAAFAPRGAASIRVCCGGVAAAFGAARPAATTVAAWLQDVDVVLLTAGDLTFWNDVAHDQVRLVSVNARDGDGQRVGAPFVVRDVASVRLALLGVVVRPGVRADDAATALRTALPAAQKESDAQLLLVDGEVAAARALLAEFPALSGAIASGNARTDSRLLVAANAFVAQSPQAGTALGRLELQFDHGRLTARTHRFATAFLDSYGQQRAAKVEAMQHPPAVAPEAEQAENEAPLAGLPGVHVDAAEVDAAIARGAEFLYQDLRTEVKSGTKFGVQRDHFLLALALVHAGLPARDPTFDQELHKMLLQVEVPALGTYAAGLYCMLLEAYGHPELYGRLRECARWLVEGQSAGGTWTYDPKVDPTLCNDPDRRVLQVTGGVPLAGVPEKVEAWQRITPWTAQPPGDHSITQFALLGLRAAQRCGVPVPAETWRRAAAQFRRGQRSDGGFGYEASGNYSYGSMTLAGICSLAICTHLLGEAEFAQDQGVRQGLGWLRAHFAVDQNPEMGQHFFYYLYSLERTGRILDRERVCGKEWYPLGVQQLLARRNGDGVWDGGGESPRIATSFALLFLTRSTQQLRVALKHGGSGRLITAVTPPPDARFYVVLDASGSMLDQLGNRSKFDVARAAVADLLACMPAGQSVALRVYGHRRRATEPDADQDTELVLPAQPLALEPFLARLRSLRARGKTPLAASLRAAAQDIGTGGKGPQLVLLLTDGGEDTMPRQDPVAAAAALASIPNVKLHVVGFDIQRDDWQKQLRAIAQAGHGDYWPAGADNLATDLRAAVLQAPDLFTVLDAAGVEVAHGRFGDRLALPEGRYRLSTTFGGKAFASDLWINTEADTAVVFAGAAALAVVQGQSGLPLCAACGKPLAADARFCASCGARTGK